MITCLWCKSEINNHSPSSLNVDGKDKGRDYTMKEMKSNEQLNKDGGDFDATEKISIISGFVSLIVPFFMKFRSVIKMSNIEWLTWVLALANVFSDLIIQILFPLLFLSSVSSLPDLDIQLPVVVNGIVLFVVDTFLHNFQSIHAFPERYLVACCRSQ
jgi:hypothetical protein